MRETASISDSVNLGFANLNSTICNQQYDTASMINGLNVNLLQAQNAIQSQAAQCCCDTQQNLAQVNYNLSTQGCETRNTIQNSTRDIIDNQNANTRAILDKMCQQEIEAKNAQIQAMQQKIFGLELSASQAVQTNDIVTTLRPFPVASYAVPNPFTGSYGYNNYNNCGCGCGCGF